MKRIVLISDNHGYAGMDIWKYLDACDEIWHAGDMGTLESIEAFTKRFVFRAVVGNIDTADIRATFPEDLTFECEGVKVLMTHIGGYPGRYSKRVIPILNTYQPRLFISGHSHICKVMYDSQRQCLHMNPGSYGFQGWHMVRTLIRFTCCDGKIDGVEVVELGSRSFSFRDDIPLGIQ
ncbi:MAG TPA: metallophosphoesterase family protein [Saprospiraceae bacterium]|nr:metallophosphoesterase family protein [Saprospiraceae bacterium]